MCPPVSLARHFVNKFLAARCSVAVGELAVETRRHQRGGESLQSTSCPRDIDPGPSAPGPTRHSPPPIEQPSRTKDKNAKTQNFPARTAARDSLFIKWQLSLDDKSHRCLATLILSEQSPIVNLYDYLLLTAVDSVSSWW